MQYTEINGRTFEVYRPNTSTGEQINHVCLTKCNTYYYYDDIFKAYDRPSHRKVNIWGDWVQWFSEIKANNKEIWIASRNSNFFSIGFRFEKGGFKYRGYITPTHNKVVII